MDHAKTFAFKEISILNNTLFLWYKLAEEPEDNCYIVPDRLLSYEAHREALMYE